MKRFVIVLTFFFVLLSPSFVLSEERLAECDECGYCQSQHPQVISEGWIKNWKKCRDCLYPDVTKGEPSANHTLKVVEPTGNLSPEEKKELARPVQPIPGKYYTQLGCIDTTLSTFKDPGAAGGLLNFLLTKLIFPVTGVLGFLALLYGAFLLITAQGNSMQIQIGKSYIIGAIVGLIFVFSSILLVSLIGGDILKIPWLSRGTKIEILTGGIRNGTDRDLIADPEMIIWVNDKEIGRFVVPGVDYVPALSEYKTYSLNYPKFDPQKDILSIEYPNDYCQRIYNCGGSGPSANRDILVESIVVDGKKCLIFDNPGDVVDRSPSAWLFWNAKATCTEWSL